MFKVGGLYSRKDIYEILNVPKEKQKGSWNTGYRTYNGEYFIFVGINTSGRTGHNYHNHWEGKLLYWKGKSNSHKDQPIIKGMLEETSVIHIFTRTDSKDVNFKYEGLGKVEKFEDTVPVTIYWRFDDNYKNGGQEVVKDIIEEAFLEGEVKDRSIKYYKRNKEARDACINYYGYDCYICGMNFEKVYGEIGKDFIEVHHIEKISTYGDEYIVDPIKDLRPICSNCHSMIHRRKETYSIDEIRSVLKANEVNDYR